MAEIVEILSMGKGQTLEYRRHLDSLYERIYKAPGTQNALETWLCCLLAIDA